MIQFDDHIFQMGWNHQLENVEFIFPGLLAEWGKVKVYNKDSLTALTVNMKAELVALHDC